MVKKGAAGVACVLLMVLAAYAIALYAQHSQNAQNAQGAPAGAGSARGEYLVEEVARCWECHTPMTGPEEWDRVRWLQGAPVWFRPVRPVREWAYWAPGIAGLENFTDEQARTILEQGVGPNGLALRLPMHTYRLAPEDAQAVIAYLRARSWRPRQGPGPAARPKPPISP